MMDMDDMPASPAAIRSWAPYGMSPWMRHENVSSRLALFRGSRPNFCDMFLAIPPTVIMAIVLLAVHRLARETIRQKEAFPEGPSWQCLPSHQWPQSLLPSKQMLRPSRISISSAVRFYCLPPRRKQQSFLPESCLLK